MAQEKKKKNEEEKYQCTQQTGHLVNIHNRFVKIPIHRMNVCANPCRAYHSRWYRKRHKFQMPLSLYIYMHNTESKCKVIPKQIVTRCVFVDCWLCFLRAAEHGISGLFLLFCRCSVLIGGTCWMVKCINEHDGIIIFERRHRVEHFIDNPVKLFFFWWQTSRFAHKSISNTM